MYSSSFDNRYVYRHVDELTEKNQKSLESLYENIVYTIYP